jgi:two-component system phosphate regulon sensor histidine kinase PhoR
MRRKRLLWQVYPSCLLITLASLAAVTWYFSNALREFSLDQKTADLEIRDLLLEQQVREELVAAKPEEGKPEYLRALRERLDPLCKKLGEKASTRITVILPGGEVVGDTNESPESMDNHAGRKEIREALKGGTGESLRYSRTLREDRKYVAVPLKAGGEVIGILRTSIPETSIDDELRAIQVRIAVGSLVVALLVAAISLFVSRRISRPLEELKRGAEHFARGDLRHKLPLDDPQEIAALAETLNQMAAELDDRIRTVVGQRNERGAILSSMVEGVIAVDSRQRLLSLNQAGARLIGVDAELAQGRKLPEVVRNRELQRLVAGVLAGRETMEEEIVLDENEQRTLHACGTVLRDADGEGIGALVVLNDVTRLRRLENVRREFVANVSHELKTPVTSIMGFVETLLDGAMNHPEDAQRFLQIVAGQTHRLGAIIEDLLSLSRIEQEADRDEIELTCGPVRDVLEGAIEACRMKAQEKHIRIELDCQGELQAATDAPLLEQAMVNLIDNAIKYSPDGHTVHVEATRTPEEVVLRVRDHGCGIGREHLPRIFERFYRVDKARSRKLGGTGLGLAIVKHIAQAHGGRAAVQSTPDQGSTFSIHLPAAEAG